jgi:serine/threonine protein kinase
MDGDTLFHPSLNQRAAAWRLLGETLSTGWVVIEALGWDPMDPNAPDKYNGTGGNFSVPYKVKRNGEEAFLKAIDFTEAMGADDVLSKLNDITMAHTFEKELLEYCADAKLDHVVIATESGQHRLGKALEDTAPFLIFELADGDVRRRIKKVGEDVKLAWWLRAMHHTSVGLSQLHNNNVFHQDIKPSNVLSFNSEAEFKVADLGRSVWKGNALHENLFFPGDMSYAPIEVLYGYTPKSSGNGRLGNDTYMLGSMAVFYIMGAGITQLIIDKLHPDYRPRRFGGSWNGSFQVVLPNIQTAFTEILIELEEATPDSIRIDLTKAVCELCSPDPSLRGHPLERTHTSTNTFRLERYVSLFDRLAKIAEINSRRN